MMLLAVGGGFETDFRLRFISFLLPEQIGPISHQLVVPVLRQPEPTFRYIDI